MSYFQCSACPSPDFVFCPSPDPFFLQVSLERKGAVEQQRVRSLEEDLRRLSAELDEAQGVLEAQASLISLAPL